MSRPAAKQGDLVTGTDMHVVLTPYPTLLPHPFSGPLAQALATSVHVDGRPAATVDSIALNSPPHVPAGGAFQRPPHNRGTVVAGSATVLVEGRPFARDADPALTCNDPADAVTARVIAASSVLVG